MTENILPPLILEVSRIRFFRPTANESSPETPVVGSCPTSNC